METSRRALSRYDQVIEEIGSYVAAPPSFSKEALQTARACLKDSIGCALLSLSFPACTKLLGPEVPGVECANGCPIPGTAHVLSPVQAAFNLGTMIRWLDYNDTWLAAEWGHPSDNLGAILACADWMCRTKQRSLTIKDVLHAAIKAHEIQGVLALKNSFNRIGHDHVILVKIASTAVATYLLGGNPEQIKDAVSNAWIDTGPLRTYRHYPNTGSRKSWAAGDQTARGVQLALRVLSGEMGYETALSAPKWGFQDVLMDGSPIELERPLSDYVMTNVLFKISFPAEFHAQTAVECALALHPHVKGRHDDIERIEVSTHESAIRIIDKTGPLKNPADRDHCLQYMSAIALLKGALTAEDYEDDVAADPRIDQLREKMVVTENPIFSQDYLDPEKRSIANAMKIIFKDGTATDTVTVEYPVGHRRRRQEGLPLLEEKFQANLETCFSKEKAEAITRLIEDDSAPCSTLLDHLGL